MKKAIFKKVVAVVCAAVMAVAMIGCGEKAPSYKNDVKTADLRQAVIDSLGENYWANMEVPADILEMLFGVKAEMCEEYIAYMPMMMTNVDTLVIVKAAEGQLEAVQTALTVYRDSKVNDTMQYPMNVGKTQASKLATYGNYVVFVQLGADTMELMDQGDEAVAAHCAKVNEDVLALIEGMLKNE
jgi:hypothetical protein